MPILRAHPRLDAALDAVPPALLAPLRNARLLVTGATGFFGIWLRAALERLQSRGWGLSVQCVSRNPPPIDAASAAWLRWLRSDAAGLAHLRIDPRTTHVIHMAASSDSRLYVQDPLAAARVILDGTLGAIALARATGAHLHFVSSGAVYGPRKASEGPAREDQAAFVRSDLLDRGQIYAHAKRMAESLVAAGSADYGISRPFAFLGPGLPLDQHFAAGNFVRDAVEGRPILIQGDGTPLRSYMHPADLAAWLLALTGGGPRGQAVNIGSDEPLSILALAHAIAQAASAPAPQPRQEAVAGSDASAYWPDVHRAHALGLSLTVPLGSAITDALAWAHASNSLPACGS